MCSYSCLSGLPGIAGGGGPNLAAAGVGTTVCELYDPRKPIGQRWSTLGDSGIWRLYHSWAFLTKNATVRGAKYVHLIDVRNLPPSGN